MRDSGASPPPDHGSLIDRPAELIADSVGEDSISDCFDAIVRHFPSRLAIQDTAVSLTSAELAALVDRIAVATAAATTRRPGPVAILLPADASLPAAMLGVLGAGRAYVPLDADFPVERNASIIAEANAGAVISSGALAMVACAAFAGDVPP